jgi:hypothetical protein
MHVNLYIVYLSIHLCIHLSSMYIDRYMSLYMHAYIPCIRAYVYTHIIVYSNQLRCIAWLGLGSLVLASATRALCVSVCVSLSLTHTYTRTTDHTDLPSQHCKKRRDMRQHAKEGLEV